MADSVQILPLAFDRAGATRFLAVAHEVYRDDPHWVAPVLIDALPTLSPRNPFFEHASLDWWIARRDGRDAGRIAVIHDRHYRSPDGEPTAFFGFFESVRDPAVAEALFRTALEHARSRGFRRILGPMNPSANDECGLLIRGFDSDPALMMTYNPDYYPGLVEAAGFRKAKDLLAFDIALATSPGDRMERVARRFLRTNPGLELRPVVKRSLAGDLPLIKQIYNEAWEDNWGFTAMTEGEVDFLARRLRPLLTPGLVWLAHDRGEPAGFLLALLDFNQAAKPLRGRLLGPGLFRALPYFLGLRRPTAIRVIALGVRPQFRRRGIEVVMLHQALQVGHRLGIRSAEGSWVLEDNVAVQQTIGHMGGRVSKVYRLYDRALD